MVNNTQCHWRDKARETKNHNYKINSPLFTVCVIYKKTSKEIKK